MNAQGIIRFAIFVLSTAGFGLVAGEARAQPYPSKPITVVVPYGPGSGNDVIARIIAQKVSENWGHPLVVENRAGATGGIALEYTAKAAPNGYTVIIASTSQIINQHLSKVRYDFVRDYAPVSQAGVMRYVLAVTRSASATSMQELVALARSRPGKLNHAGTTGGVAYFMGEMLKSAAGVDIVFVSYKNSTDAESDVFEGRVEIWFTTMNIALPQLKAGKVRILSVAGDKRAPELPDVPTMAENGFPALDVSAGFFFLAPATTPKPIVAALNSEIVKAIATKDVRARLAAAGVEPKSSSPEELGALIKSDVERWRKVVKETGIRVD